MLARRHILLIYLCLFSPGCANYPCQYSSCIPPGENIFNYPAEPLGYYAYPQWETCPYPASNTSHYCPDGSRAVVDENGNVTCVELMRHVEYPSDTSSGVIRFNEVNPKAMGMNAVKLASVIGDALTSISCPVDNSLTEVKNDTIKLVTKERSNRINTAQGLVEFDDKEIIKATIKSNTENIVIEVESIRLLQSSGGKQRAVIPPEGEAKRFFKQFKTALQNYNP